MSLVTRCPACSTLFKVVPDQLRISDGWVRCGRCGQVFDGSEAALPPPAATAGLGAAHPHIADRPHPAQPATTGGAAVRPGDALAWSEASQRVRHRPGAAARGSPDGWPVLPATAPGPAPGLEDGAPDAGGAPFAEADRGSGAARWANPPRSLNADAGAIRVALAPSGADTAAASADTAAPDATGHPAAVTAPIDALDNVDPFDEEPSALLLHTAASGADLPESELDPTAGSFVPSKPPPMDDAEIDALVQPPVGFVRDARRRAFWRRPWVRTGAVALCLLLAAALALQAGVQERDRVVATVPALRPLAAAVCRVLGCTLGPLQQIELIAIESSSFNRARGDGYLLRVVLRNTGGTTVATPALELTLTDSADQPVLRRVLLPADVGAAPELAARGEWAGGATLALAVPAQRIAGYRLLAFYP